MGGVALDPVSVEITYGLERILIALNNAKAIWNEEYGAGVEGHSAVGSFAGGADDCHAQRLQFADADARHVAGGQPETLKTGLVR